MFNETSYPLCGLGDAAAVQRRLDAGKRVKQSKLDKFGIVAPDGYTTLPLPKVKKSKGVMVGTPQMPIDSGDMGLIPATDSGTTDDSGNADSGGGFDLGGIFSALPWWVWAIGAYMLLKKR